MTDLRHLDAVLDNLCRDARGVAEMIAYLQEARDVLAVAPDDPEAAHRVHMSEIRMRGDAYALAQHFAALATPAEAAR